MVYRRNLGLRPSPVRTAALLAAHRANAPKSTGPVTAPGEARVALNGLQHGGRTDRLPEKLLGAAGNWEGGNYRHLGEGQAAGGAAGRSNCGCGVVPGARGGALTSKAGMSFSFMGIMLATPPSIKDSFGERIQIAHLLADAFSCPSTVDHARTFGGSMDYSRRELCFMLPVLLASKAQAPGQTLARSKLYPFESLP